ncbi:hypothetical protein M409DRAFT_69351 [Zasmidium cellare ATCC 36951]|uniref:SAM domain-containing protein n=1 Tax=Zasmidium cellare ATCC 36951 TaxID=1080233 RepID=A0A6A6C7F3_ZASCE|nr:uncharacterized protein M409DRAFT_69351 [Zasmidium cellare ATCC 36951]KAF2162140.1 hypothetical protein M409DRAFT_69351 [Zasmidium cellare ATCC 36951]
MDRYARQAGDNTYDSDGEADDEFERSVFSSPIIASHFHDDHSSDHPSDSEDARSLVDGEDTPTTQAWTDREGRSPTGNIIQWTEEEAADFVVSLSPAFKQYGQTFVDEGVNGEALTALHHDELRELGVASVGHRLTILKAVYEQKMRAGVKIEEEDYVPLSADGEKGDVNATQDDIARIIESIRLRDARIIATESELRVMKRDLDRIVEENKKLREETLPIMRLVKDQRTPLPDPAGGTIPSPRELDQNRQAQDLANQNKGSSLSRKFSTKKLFLKSADNAKQPSPTHPPPQTREVRDDGGTHLEASAAAMAASSHLTASMTSQTSPNSVHGQQLSPTSPAYAQPPGSGGSYHQPGAAPNRSFPRDGNVSRHDQRSYGHGDETGGYSTGLTDQSTARLQQDKARRQAPTPSPREDETPHSGRDKDNPQVEIFKSFRVSIDDPCRVVLPVALKRYNITDDWRQYALYIVHGDQERCLGLEEKPLLLFKQLDKEGRKPMFMLRRHASPQEGWSGSVGGEPKVSR